MFISVEIANPVCGICLEGFVSKKEQFVLHPGGESHPYHLECVKPWVVEHQNCPHDRRTIDPSSVLSRTERAVALLREGGRHALSAGALYASSATIGAALAGVPGMVAMTVATGLRMTGRAAIDASVSIAEDEDAAAADALADSERAARIAAENGSPGSFLLANEADEGASVMASFADAAEERAAKKMAAAQKAEMFGNLGLAAASLTAGSLTGSAAVFATSYIVKELGCSFLEHLQIQSRDRRISRAASGAGGLAAFFLLCTYPGIDAMAAFAFGGLVCGVTAILSSHIS